MNLSVQEAANVLKVSPRTIYRWVEQGSLPVYRVNEQYRFNRAELLQWATSRRMNVSADIFSEPESDHTPPPSLADAIQKGGIHYRVEGSDKASVLRAVVDMMRLPEGVERKFWLDVLMAREALGSTGIGDGIAIPHVRNPVIVQFQEPTVTVCFLEKPVDFDSLDGRPVHTLFVMTSPTIRAHLQLLSKISFALRHPDFKRVIECQGAREEILNEARRAEGSFAQPPRGSLSPLLDVDPAIGIAPQ